MKWIIGAAGIGAVAYAYVASRASYPLPKLKIEPGAHGGDARLRSIPVYEQTPLPEGMRPKVDVGRGVYR